MKTKLLLLVVSLVFCAGYSQDVEKMSYSMYDEIKLINKKSVVIEPTENVVKEFKDGKPIIKLIYPEKKPFTVTRDELGVWHKFFDNGSYSDIYIINEKNVIQVGYTKVNGYLAVYRNGVQVNIWKPEWR